MCSETSELPLPPFSWLVEVDLIQLLPLCLLNECFGACQKLNTNLLSHTHKFRKFQSLGKKERLNTRDKMFVRTANCVPKRLFSDPNFDRQFRLKLFKNARHVQITMVGRIYNRTSPELSLICQRCVTTRKFAFSERQVWCLLRIRILFFFWFAMTYNFQSLGQQSVLWLMLRNRFKVALKTHKFEFDSKLVFRRWKSGCMFWTYIRAFLLQREFLFVV